MAIGEKVTKRGWLGTAAVDRDGQRLYDYTKVDNRSVGSVTRHFDFPNPARKSDL